MKFHVLGAAASDPDFEEARFALQRRGRLVTGEPADIVVGEVPPGMRTVPPEVVAAARAHAASAILLWTREAMVRPVAAVRDNVVIVSCAKREYVLAGLDILLKEELPTATTCQQALHRTWWSGWAVGAGNTRLHTVQSDATGATLLYSTKSPESVSAALRAPTDSRRQALLQESFGDELEMVHLTPDASHWIVNWMRPVPLWLFSPLRMPSRWSVSATLAATATSFIRMSAFPGDLMVAASISEDQVVHLINKLPLGPLEVFRTLGELARERDHWGFVIEAR